MQKGRGLPEITKLGRYSASHTLLKYMKKWGVRRCIYPTVRPYWGTSAQKGNDKKTKGIRNVRTICEQIGIKVGHVNEWIIKEQRQVGPWERWISWCQEMSQIMTKRVGHTASMKRWNQLKGAVCDGLEQRGQQRTWDISKNKPTTQLIRIGGCILLSGAGHWQIGASWWYLVGV